MEVIDDQGSHVAASDTLKVPETGDDIESELQAHLTELSSEGIHQGGGAFQIGAAKALEKFGSNTLLDPAFWVLKIVQAAVVARAPLVKFRFYRSSVKIEFENRAEWVAGDLLREFSTGKLSKCRGKRHLMLGLASSLNNGISSITWTAGGEQCRLTREQTDIDKHNGKNIVIEATRAKSRNWVNAKSTNEVLALTKHTKPCPIEIMVDGRRLPRRYAVYRRELSTIWPHKLDPEQPKQTLAVKPIARIAGAGVLCYRDGMPGDEPIDSADYSNYKPNFSTLYLGSEGAASRAVLCVLYSPDSHTSDVAFTQDGVVLLTSLAKEVFAGQSLWSELEQALCINDRLLEEHDQRFVFRLYIEVSPDDLDLSQFGVRTERYQKVLARLPSRLVGMLKMIENECTKPWAFEPLDKKVRNKPLRTGAVLGTAALAIKFPVLIFAGSYIGMMSGILYGLAKVGESKFTSPYFGENLSPAARRARETLEALQRRLETAAKYKD